MIKKQNNNRYDKESWNILFRSPPQQLGHFRCYLHQQWNWDGRFRQGRIFIRGCSEGNLLTQWMGRAKENYQEVLIINIGD